MTLKHSCYWITMGFFYFQLDFFTVWTQQCSVHQLTHAGCFRIIIPSENFLWRTFQLITDRYESSFLLPILANIPSARNLCCLNILICANLGEDIVRIFYDNDWKILDFRLWISLPQYRKNIAKFSHICDYFAFALMFSTYFHLQIGMKHKSFHFHWKSYIILCNIYVQE